MSRFAQNKGSHHIALAASSSKTTAPRFTTFAMETLDCTNPCQKDHRVRARVAEFLGGNSPANLTCQFFRSNGDLIDFNCYSSHEEKTCPLSACPENLDRFRQSALAHKKYGYLAHRPFNRLFLPTEHL